MAGELTSYLSRLLDQYPKKDSSRNLSYLIEAVLICASTFLWLEFADMGALYHWLYPIVAASSLVVGHFIITESGCILFKFKGIKVARYWLISFSGIVGSFCLVYFLGLCGFVCRVIGSYCPITWHTSPPDTISVFFRTVFIPWGLSKYLFVQSNLKQQLEYELLEIKSINQALQQKKSHENNPLENKNGGSPKQFPFPVNSLQINLLLDDIRFIRVEDHYCKIVYQDEDTIKEEMLRLTLKEVLIGLSETSFAQVHRSFIVNLDSVKAIKKKGQAYSISLADIEESIPASRHRAHQFLPKLKQILN